MDILVTGGSGSLGSRINELLPNVFAPTKFELDVSEPWSLDKRYDIVIHCAALVRKKCKDRLLAFKTNVVGTFNAVDYCFKNDSRLVYISTEYVFGHHGPHSSNDCCCPVSYYGETKLAGEIASRSLENHLIVRCSFMDGFDFQNAYSDHISSKMPIDDAACSIIDLAKSTMTGNVHVFGKRRSIYDYVTQELGLSVGKIPLTDPEVPRDSSLC